jgi:hypothetical protein
VAGAPRIAHSGNALEQPGAHIGGWSFENNAVLDVSVVDPDELTALVKAKDADQKAIFICPVNAR